MTSFKFSTTYMLPTLSSIYADLGLVPFLSLHVNKHVNGEESVKAF